MTKNCQQCNKEFRTFPSSIKRGGGKFCTHKCMGVFYKGIDIAKNKGRISSEETLKKLKENFIKNGNYGMKNKHHTEKTKQKIRAKLKSYVFTDEHRKNLIISRKGRKPGLGHFPSIETRKKLSKNNPRYWLGKKNPNVAECMSNRIVSKKTRLKMSIFHINNPSRVFKDTKPEIQMEELLKRLGVDYQKQVPLFNTARVDFYIPSKNLVIQVDGCYWHGCPIHFPNSHQEKKERDIRQDKILQENGLTVIRFWEHEIMSPNFLIKDLINN